MIEDNERHHPNARDRILLLTKRPNNIHADQINNAMKEV